MNIGDNFDGLENIVENKQLFRQKKQRIKGIDLFGFVTRQVFNKTNHVIAEVTHHTTKKPRQAVHLNGLKRGLNTAELFQRIGSRYGMNQLPVFENLKLIALAAEYL